MASNISSRSESPVEIDFSVIRTAIQMNHSMIDQVLHGIHYGSDEVRSLLREECDIILECKVCRNLFRSFPNFVAHKRVYCMETFEEKAEKNSFTIDASNSETVVVHPESPEDKPAKATNKSARSLPDTIIDKTFEGRSKEYQFYTKIAENVERQKVTKVTNTVSLTTIPTNQNAVMVAHSEGDNSEAILKAFQEQQELEKAKKAPKKKSSLVDVCDGLVKKSQAALEGNQKSSKSPPVARKIIARSRKSSPRKSVEYVQDAVEKSLDRKAKGTKSAIALTDDDENDWVDITDNSEDAAGNISDKEWIKYCDINKKTCTACNKSFTSLQSLKFHARMKHVSDAGQYHCPECSNTFEYFTSLASHLRTVHLLPDSSINNVKMKLSTTKSPKKSPKKMETDAQQTVGADSKKDKSAAKLLPYSTGWKKCDRCGKVFWKAKSYARHRSGCKGPVNKQQDIQPSPVNPVSKGAIYTPKSIETIVVGPEGKVLMRTQNKELLKLQEKLRAKALTPTLPTKTAQSSAEQEKDVPTKPSSQRKDGGKLPNASPELYKALTRPITANEAALKKDSGTMPEGAVKHVTDTKYKLRMQKTDKDTPEKNDSQPSKTRAASSERSGSETTSKNTNEFKKLELRLTREAGLTDAEAKAERERTKAYSLRHSGPSKEPLTPVKDKETVGKIERESYEEAPVGNFSAQKKSGTPEIQELHQKLAREALGQKAIADADEDKEEKEEEKTVILGESDKPTDTFVEPQNSVERRARDLERSKIMSQVEAVRSTRNMTRSLESSQQDRSSSSESGKRSRPVSESSSDLAGKRHFRSVSQGSESVKRTGERTPEKSPLSLQASPVVARRQSFPTSPTHSLHSNSGDGYNFKFKMTVKEMAELVESASLTKFAKERKKKAKTFLTKKQAKDSQKVAPILSKPIKKKRWKKNPSVVVRSTYGTRRSGVSQEDKKTEGDMKSKRLLLEQRRLQNSAGFVEDKFYGYSHSSGSKDGQKLNEAEKGTQKAPGVKETRLSAGLTVESKSSENQKGTQYQKAGTARDSSAEGRQSREIKKLANSAGFVEDKYYTSSSRDSSRDRLSESGHERTKAPKEVLRVRRSEGVTSTSIAVKSGISEVSGKDSIEGTGRLSRNRIREVPASRESLNRLRTVSNSSTESGERKRLRTISADASKSGQNVGTPEKKHGSGSLAKDSGDGQFGRDSSDKEISDTNSSKAASDENKHRTRLSTGSIQVDSVLLKLSPSKLEKRTLEDIATKGQDKGKEALLKSQACKRLNLSPRQQKTSQSTGSKLGFYPLSTGMFLCTQCQKRFWKKKSFEFHMLHSCKFRKLLKHNTGKKRMLSLSPEDSKTIKSKDEVSHADVTSKKIKLEETEDEFTKTPEIKTKGNKDTGNEEVMEESTTSTADSGKGDSPIFENPNKDCNKNESVNISNKVEETSFKNEQLSRNPLTTSSKVVSTSGNTADRAVSESRANTSQEIDDTNIHPSISKPTSSKTSDTKTTKAMTRSSTGAEVTETKTFKDNVERNVKGVADDVKQATADLAHDRKTKAANKSIDVENTESLEKPGPSGLNRPQSLPEKEESDDDDDNCSDFSGFTEEDLKETEEELTAHLNVSGTAEHIVEFQEEELSDLGDCDLSSDDDLEVVNESKDKVEITPDAEETKSKRPARKSAQNRFGHIEEIWVYKEPGKPVVERSKAQTPQPKEPISDHSNLAKINTREYVVDVAIPTKLHCHNSKDIDRLVDEKGLKCKQCDTPCNSMSNLRRHVITHLGWKRYKCRLCTYVCYDKSRCIRHCGMSHNVKLTEDNFMEYVIDLKKEATKIRADKRTNTIRSAKNKLQGLEADIYVKPKVAVCSRGVSPKVAKSESKVATSTPKSDDLLKKARNSLEKALKDT